MLMNMLILLPPYLLLLMFLPLPIKILKYRNIYIFIGICIYIPYIFMKCAPPQKFLCAPLVPGNKFKILSDPKFSHRLGTNVRAQARIEGGGAAVVSFRPRLPLAKPGRGGKKIYKNLN